MTHPLRQVAVLVDRAHWLATELQMYAAARDHFLLGAEIAQRAGLDALETKALRAAYECQQHLVQEARR